MMMAPLAIAAALCLATVALAEPPSGWKTCGGLPDNYSNTACDTATTTVRALSIKHCMFCAAPYLCLPHPAGSSLRWLCCAVRHDGLAAEQREVGVLPIP